MLHITAQKNLQLMIANTVVMIRPNHFGFNEQTAASNAFQRKLDGTTAQLRANAIEEFEAYVSMLRNAGIDVIVFDDKADPVTPDAVFPNNWFSTCPHTHRIFTYPMKNDNRRMERRHDVIASLADATGYVLDESLLANEAKDLALEGTGSLVLDHIHRKAYGAISPRTDLNLLREWADKTGFEPIAFHAYGPAGELIYHTNVLMTMADSYVVICLEAVKDDNERRMLIDLFNQTNKDVIEISEVQMNAFAGNMLQLQNQHGQKYLIMSSSAQESLTAEQIHKIEIKHENKILAPDITTIETIGGGSARCMIAEVFGV